MMKKTLPNQKYVLVKMYEDLIDDVQLFKKEESAELAFEQYTGVSFEDYTKQVIEGHEDADQVINEFAGTMIFVVTEE